MRIDKTFTLKESNNYEELKRIVTTVLLKFHTEKPNAVALTFVNRKDRTKVLMMTAEEAKALANEILAKLAKYEIQPSPVVPDEAFFAEHGYPPSHDDHNKKLATAEVWAKQLGYHFEWINDEDHLREHKEPFEKTCESCLMWSKADELPVQSLGCVDDASPEYRRLVEAELALQQMNELALQQIRIID